MLLPLTEDSFACASAEFQNMQNRRRIVSRIKHNVRRKKRTCQGSLRDWDRDSSGELWVVTCLSGLSNRKWIELCRALCWCSALSQSHSQLQLQSQLQSPSLSSSSQSQSHRLAISISISVNRCATFGPCRDRVVQFRLAFLAFNEN